jgi:23S rRNA pseudouridine2605 synthase
MQKRTSNKRNAGKKPARRKHATERKHGTERKQGTERKKVRPVKSRDVDKFIEEKNRPVRLNKFIADSGYCSRRKADELIADGVVKVNGKSVTELGTKVLPSDNVTVKGDPVKENIQPVYILLNKPKNIITTTDDDLDRKTVMHLVRKESRIFPVGRLDRNTTGVLLLTNDGELAYRLTHPKFEIKRTYKVNLDKKLSSTHAEIIVRGVKLEDGQTAPAHIWIEPEDPTKVEITLTEGKNHEVKRIFSHFNYEVKQLDRILFAGLSHKGVDKGKFRHLTRKEINSLKTLVGLFK